MTCYRAAKLDCCMDHNLTPACNLLAKEFAASHRFRQPVPVHGHVHASRIAVSRLRKATRPGPNRRSFGGEGGIRTLGAGLYPLAGLANRCLQPLGHPSRMLVAEFLGARRTTPHSRLFSFHSLAEEEGFEPPELSLGGFQDRCLRPLGHSPGMPGGKTRRSIDR